jgi:hypothetical protein
VTHKNGLLGVFQFPEYDTPNGQCKDHKRWPACPAYKTGVGGRSVDQIILFAGASSMDHEQQQMLLPGTFMYSRAEDAVGPEGKIWYNFAGGRAVESNWLTQDKLNELNQYIRDKTISTEHYHGIMYDIEVIREWGIDFESSFILARQHGLKVLVTTSYTAPWSASGYPINPNTGKQDIEGAWKPLLSSPNVHIWSPQLYTGLFQTNGVDVTFTFWTENVNPKAQIIPMLRIYEPGIEDRGGSKDGEFQHWINKMHHKCEQHVGFKLFCDAGKYFLWSGS